MDTIGSLFNPAAVAVIGASHTPGKIGNSIVRNIIASGYRGAIFPVNPAGGEVCGLKCFKSIEDIQETVDVACTVVPARLVHDAVLASALKGVKYNLIITSGFSETGNIDEEKKLVQTARAHGMRIVGPNIFGLYSAEASMDATFGTGNIKPGPVAIITQSGALGLAMIGKTGVESIGLSAIVSVGNKCDIDESDLLAYLVQQQATKVILMYIEGIRKGERFIRALKKATRVKPVVVIKSGRSARGAAAAASHTGSLAGADEIVDAILRQCGALRADSIAEAFSWCAYLAHAPAPAAEQTVIITNGGGVGVMATDACERYEIPLYNDSEALRDIFAPVTPSYGSTKNPIDITGGAAAPEYSQALDAALAHDRIGAAMALYCETAVFPAADLETMLEDTHRRYSERGRPVLFAAVGGEDIEHAIVRLRKKNVPVFNDVYQAVACMGKLFEHYRQKRSRCDTFEDCAIDTAAIDAITADARTSGRSFLSARESRDIMRIIGLKMPASCVARSLDEALARCSEVGFPLVMKVVSPDIIHKSDAGGVVLDLHNSTEVIDAWQAIMQRCLAFLPGARVDGIELSAMIEPGVETIVGARRDPVFGPIAMFGQGGIYVEVMKDVAFRSLPLNRLEILAMMKQTRTYPLLLGVRGEAKKDIEGVLEAIIKVGALVRACDYISDIEINPLVVFEENAGANALDVRILLATQRKEQP